MPSCFTFMYVYTKALLPTCGSAARVLTGAVKRYPTPKHSMAAEEASVINSLPESEYIMFKIYLRE